jgi:hypothetical protein
MRGAESTRRKSVVVLLVGLGAVAVVAGVITALVAKASINRVSTVFSGPIPTLPVHTYAQYSQHTYAQYTQHFVAPDYTSVSIVLAAVGTIALVWGLVVAFHRPRAA